MRTLKQKLESLGYERAVDFSLREQGGVSVIDEWMSADPQPSESTLAALTDQEVDDGLETKKLTNNFSLSKRDRVLVKWIAQRTGGGTPAEIRNELRTIWRNTQ